MSVTQPPSMDDFRYEDVVSLLHSGKHAPFLAAYFGEPQYEELRQLACATPAARRPDLVVYILPGVMGSKLGREDGVGARLLWLNPNAIASGSMLELAHTSPSTINAVGVMLGGYMKIRLTLELQGFDVRFYSYDWRADIETSALGLLARIEADQPKRCALIAHSMGGLVARIALTRARNRRITQLIQLGTPNGGSYAPLQALRAVYPTVRKIATLDPAHSAEEFARRVFLTLPGLYQMLPSSVPPASLDLFDESNWPQDDLRPELHQLKRAREVHRLFAPADERCFAICGVAQETVTSVRLTRDAGFEYIYTREGDGTVPVSMSSWANARTWYSATAHGALTLDNMTIAATMELLEGGDCKTLPVTAPPPSTTITRQSTDAQLRLQATGKVRWDALPILARRMILEPVLSQEFLSASAS
jgi:pimeloyl-ACP methyl ester carboxylesterase